MSTHQYANNPSSALSGGVTAGDTSISVTSATGFPSQGKFTIIIDSEIILVTGVAGATWTVERGREGTTAAAHNNNATVTQILTVDSFLNAQHYDVRAYGARGDGVTDDTAALIAAVTAAAGGGTVYLPPGTYVTTSSLTPASNTVIRGAGPATLISCAANAATISVVGGASHVTVRDLKIVGAGNPDFTSNRGVHFDSASDCLVENVEIEDAFRSVSIFASHGIVARNVIVTNDVTTSTGSGAIDISSGSTRCQIDACSVIGAALHGIDIRTTDTNYNTIRGCYVQDVVGTAIPVGADAVGAGTNVGNTVVDNTIKNCGHGVLIENGSAMTRVTGNEITGCSATGITVSQGTGLTAPALTVIANNTIRDCDTDGIFINNGAYSTISGNQISVFGRDGIRINTGLNHTVTGNLLTGGTSTSDAAIRVYTAAGSTSITGNVIRSTNGHGILVDTVNCVVSGNVVVDADNTGVSTIGGIRLTANASRTTVTGNASHRSSGTKQDYGVQIDSGCTNAMVVGNLLFPNTTAATLNNGTGTTLANNITA